MLKFWALSLLMIKWVWIIWCGDPNHLITNCPVRSTQLNKGPVLTSKNNQIPVPRTNRQVGRAYVINKKQVNDVGTVVIGTLTFNFVSLVVLFDLGAIHSFISSHVAAQIRDKVETCLIDLYVNLGAWKTVKSDVIYNNCLITLNQDEFNDDLIQLKLLEFDIILGRA